MKGLLQVLGSVDNEMDDDDCVTFCSAQTGGEWVKAANDPDNQTNDSNRLRQYLGEVLRTENLNVLAGAGASMGVWGESEDTGEKERVEPTRKGLWKKAEALWDGEIDELLELVKYDASLGEDIEALLSQCHLCQAFTPSDAVADFSKEMEAAIVKACRFVNPKTRLDAHELFLRKAARRSRRLPRLKVFTTNYDLCFERAAQNSRFVVVDGFSHTLPQELDSSFFSYDLVQRHDNDEAPDYIPNVFHLYKLHGSVDWWRNKGQIFRRAKSPRPLLIYPRSSKFESSYEPPFIDMMGSFQGMLRERNTALIVVGYGFADNHLTQPILSAVRSNVGFRLVVVDPALKYEERGESLSWLEGLIRAGDSRICLVAGTFDDLVRLLPDPDVQTQQEQHIDRVRSLRQ